MCLQFYSRCPLPNALKVMHETLHQRQRAAYEVYIISQAKHCCLERACVQAIIAGFRSRM